MNLKPWDIQIEMTFGCDNKCPVCFKQVLQKPKGEYDFMTLTTAKTIATKLQKTGWENIKIEFTFRGEPTLNPNFFKIIKLFRAYMPKSQITVYSNGNNLNPQKVNYYFKCGGNILLIDCYKNDLEERKKIYNKFNVYDYFTDDFNPFHKNPLNTEAIVLVDNILTTNKQKKTRIVDNRGGNANFKYIKKFGNKPLKKGLEKKCTRPFRDITLLYDGTLVLCCLDGKPDYPIANINQIQNLKKWFNYDKKLNTARLLLYNKKRILAPCKNCDYNGGMRQGLLPKMKTLTEQQIQKLIKEDYKL